MAFTSQAGANRIAAAALCAIGAAGMVGSYRMGLWTAGSPDAGLMPFAASCLLTVLAAASILAPPGAEEGATEWRRLVSYIAAMLVFCIAPALVGSLAGFALAMFLMLHLAEGVRLRTSLMASLALSAGSIALFRVALGVPLPDPLLDRMFGF